jgi:hypothetical protein
MHLGLVLPAVAVLAPALAVLVSCKGPPVEPVDAAPSPQAKAEPAPLAMPPSSAAAAGATADGGAAPEALWSDAPLPPDSPRETPRDAGAKEYARELTGYVMQAVVHSGEGPPAPKGGEVNVAAIEGARRHTESRLTITATQTRLRVVVGSGFVLPQGTEIRARADRFGYVILWPGEATYRVAEAGSLRALFGEGRVDVAPMTHASVTQAGDGPRRLGLSTRRVEVATRAAKATLELAPARDGGEGGVLICRMLLDLMSAPPTTSACATDEIPVHAELHWTTRGAMSFDVVASARRSELAPQDLAAPPASASFTATTPPLLPSDILLPRSELAALRTAPVEPPASANKDSGAPEPDSGLLLVNASDELRFAWLDGFPVAWVAPGARAWLPSLVRGRYALQWRTFLGDSWEPPELALAPGTSTVGKSLQ